MNFISVSILHKFAYSSSINSFFRPGSSQCMHIRPCKRKMKLKIYKLNGSYYGIRNFNSMYKRFDSGKTKSIIGNSFYGIDLINYQSAKLSNFNQVVPRTSEEVKQVLGQSPVSPPSSKLLKVAIIGVPNSGKSTLINQLVGWRICSASQKVHTTQCNARAVYNDGTTQLVFLDTPGIVTPEDSKKFGLKHSMVADPELSLVQADVIAVLHDASNHYTRAALSPRIIRLLTLYPHVPSILLLNKVDILKKKHLLLGITKSVTDSVVGKTKIKTTSRHAENSQITREKLLSTPLKASDSRPDSPSKPSQPQPANKFNLNNTESTTDLELEPTRGTYDSLDETSKASMTAFEEDTANSNLRFEDVIAGNVKPTEKQVQQLIEGRTGWPHFSEVFMVSGLEGSGVEDVKDYFLSVAKGSEWIFGDDILTDQSPQEIALTTVREKCLEHLSHNIPYELRFKILYWDLLETEMLSILIGVYCRNKSHLKLLIGPAGRMVKRLASEAEQDLRNTFRTEVRLRLSFEHRPEIKDM